MRILERNKLERNKKMQEIDEYIVKNCYKVFVDTKQGVLSEAWDLIIPINKGIISEDKFTVNTWNGFIK